MMYEETGRQAMKVTIIKSNRKTISIQVHRDSTVTVRAPRYATNREIERVVREKESWIRKQLEKIAQQKEAVDEQQLGRLTENDIRDLADRALAYIPERVKHFAPLIGVSYGRITIRNQKTRWGSCSGKGNLNFNCLLMLTPPEVIDYVVVHELCHRKEMNHSKAFWQEVANILPEYKKSVAYLKKEGGTIMARAGYR